MGNARPLRHLPRLALRHAAGADAPRHRRRSATSCATASTSTTRQGRFLEKQRLEQRTLYDLEMLEQMGFCNGIENYSRHLSDRKPGEPPPTLIDYFPKDFLLIIDESHQTVPQVGAMYRGDRARKETLVEYGFRLPSALDNRPLKFEEFEEHMPAAASTSRRRPATTSSRRRRARSSSRSSARPACIDPQIEVRPVVGPGRRPARRDPRSRVEERARARARR